MRVVRLDVRWPRRRPRRPSPTPCWPRDLRDEHQRARVGGVELRGVLRVLESAGGIAISLLDGGELAIEERAVGRGGNRILVRLSGLIEMTGVSGLARAVDVRLDTLESQDVNPVPQTGTAGSAASAASNAWRAGSVRPSDSNASPLPTSAGG